MEKISQSKILKVMGRFGLTPENILLVCLSFWLTVLALRITIFWSVIHGVIPAVFIDGYHIHHFITGFVLLVAALILFSKEVFSKYIPLALTGIGIGLVVDEFLFWTRGHFDYWSLINLAAIISIGTIMVITYVHAKRQHLFSDPKFDPDPKSAPKFLTALLPILLLAIALFAMFSYPGIRSIKVNSPNVLTSERQETGKFLR